MASRTFKNNTSLVNDIVNELSVTIDGLEVAVNDGRDIDTTASSYSAYKATKAGYTPVGISGFTLSNASSSGANAANCVVYTYRINADGNFYMRVKNLGTSAAKIRIRLYILWVKNS